MIRIAITPEEIDEQNEAKAVKIILDNVWDKVHLRHPNASRRDMINLIENIPQKYHCRLVLHGHFDLVNEFNLGGLHLNRRCPEPPRLYNGALSKSCHTVDEIKSVTDAGYSYVTLSPIFDSISKPGYIGNFTDRELERLANIDNLPIIALGGVNFNNIIDLAKYNFSGYAMLGALPWSDLSELNKLTQNTTY